MSELCEVCGPNKHEAPTVMCAACALRLDVVALSFDPYIQAGIDLGEGAIDEVARRYLIENAARVYLSKLSK
jgi:hypothetical protein